MKKILFLLCAAIALFSCSGEGEEDISMKGKKKVSIEVVDENGNTVQSRATVVNGTVSGDGYYAGDANVTVSVTPNSGYKVTSFKGGTTSGSINVDYTAERTGTFNIQQSDWKFTVTIVSAMHSLTVNAEEGGTVSGSGTFAEGKGTTITATPLDGYSFVKWEINSGDATIVSPTSSTTTVNINSTNSTITAKFIAAKICYTIELVDEQLECRDMGNSAKVMMDGEELPYSYDAINNIKRYYLYNNSPNDLSIIPSNGYVFNGWMDMYSNNISQDGNVLTGYDIYSQVGEGGSVYASLTNNNVEEIFYYTKIEKITEGKELVGTSIPNSWECDKATATEYKLSCPLGSSNCGTLYLYYSNIQSDSYFINSTQPYVPTAFYRWDEYNKDYSLDHSPVFTKYKWVTPIGTTTGTIPNGKISEIMGSITSGNKTYKITGK
jgi:hypothetical protein